MSARLPDSVRAGVEAALRERGVDCGRITGQAPLGGGSINHAARLTLDGGGPVFVKWHADPPAGMFAAEVDGLEALRAARAPGLLVAEVLGASAGGERPGWLLLEYLPPAPPGPGHAEALGRGLAALHRARPTGADGASAWGWSRNNFIGSLPQPNETAPTWAAFWRDRRLAPQVRRAVDGGHLDAREAATLDRVLGRVETLLSGTNSDGPSLLHGDLWSGNTYPGPRGEAVLIDPAVYRGHREVDLSMTELFGGFPARFYDAYDEAWPLPAEYHDHRRDCYQLYYLLVHVNLFGRGYVAGTVERARRLLAG